MVVEGLQFLHPVVQLDVGSEVLVQGVVHRWRLKLDDCVVLLAGVLKGSQGGSNVITQSKRLNGDIKHTK